MKILSIGDISKNLGIFTSSILAQPQLTHGRIVVAWVEQTTMGDMLNQWAEVTGKDAVYVQTSPEAFNAVWPMWAEEMGGMMQFWNDFGIESWSEGEDVLTFKELGIKDKFATVKEAFQGQDWSFIFGK